MAWSFNRIVRIDYQELSDKWHALITLNTGEPTREITLDDGSTASVGGEESFFLKFDNVPSKAQLLVEANRMVELKNAAAAPDATLTEQQAADKYVEGN